MLPDDPIKAIALVVVLIGVVLLIGTVLYMLLPPWEEVLATAENRIAPRRRVFKAARIEFGGVVLDCLVRNISATGAAIEVTTSTQCPFAFVLAIPSDGSVRYCRVVWRRGNRMGVRFD